MHDTIPIGSRAAARVLLVDEQDRLLLLEAQDSVGGPRWWVAPGGGLRAGETFEAAAQRELYEETGLLLPMQQWVWTRRHIYDWQNRRHDQYERFFVARALNPRICPVESDGYIIGHRWWPLAELEESTDEFAPRRLARLLPPILRGEFPDPPLDCGV